MPYQSTEMASHVNHYEHHQQTEVEKCLEKRKSWETRYIKEIYGRETNKCQYQWRCACINPTLAVTESRHRPGQFHEGRSLCLALSQALCCEHPFFLNNQIASRLLGRTHKPERQSFPNHPQTPWWQCSGYCCCCIHPTEIPHIIYSATTAHVLWAAAPAGQPHLHTS